MAAKRKPRERKQSPLLADWWNASIIWFDAKEPCRYCGSHSRQTIEAGNPRLRCRNCDETTLRAPRHTADAYHMPDRTMEGRG